MDRLNCLSGNNYNLTLTILAVSQSGERRKLFRLKRLGLMRKEGADLRWTLKCGERDLGRGRISGREDHWN